MPNSREIISLIDTKIQNESNTKVIAVLEDLVKNITVMEDREMREMYKEYMQQEKLAARWAELEREMMSK